jgi:hypothetical protein
MSARAQRRSLTMPDIRLQPIPALTYLRRPSFFAGGVHIRLLGGFFIYLIRLQVLHTQDARFLPGATAKQTLR